MEDELEVLKKSAFLEESVLFQLEGKDVRVIRMTRKEFYKNRNNSKLDVAGIYVIYSTTSSQSGIYIGEGDDVRERLKQHYSEKAFWDELIIFTSERMNVAFSKNIEYRFIKRARVSSKYPLDNNVKGGTRKLGTEDKEHLKSQLVDFYKIIELSDINIFDLNEDSLFFYKVAGNSLKVAVNSFIEREVNVLEGSVIGRAFVSKINIDSNYYKTLPDGSYLLTHDFSQKVLEREKILGIAHPVSLKNENDVSLSQVFELAAG